MEVKFASHCNYQIRYHQVFCIKYRKRLLRNEVYREYLKYCIKEIADGYWFEIDEMGTDGDHVHIFVGATPKHSPSQIMQILKSISAKMMFKQFPEIKKNKLRGGSFRSEGGYIGTVGEGTNEQIIKRYIQNQGDEREREQYKQLSLFKLN